MRGEEEVSARDVSEVILTQFCSGRAYRRRLNISSSVTEWEEPIAIRGAFALLLDTGVALNRRFRDFGVKILVLLMLSSNSESGADIRCFQNRDMRPRSQSIMRNIKRWKFGNSRYEQILIPIRTSQPFIITASL
jgi:hypothetical protein